MAAGKVGPVEETLLAGHFLRLGQVLHPQDWPRPLFPAKNHLEPIIPATHQALRSGAAP